jgi:hypothetical protein
MCSSSGASDGAVSASISDIAGRPLFEVGGSHFSAHVATLALSTLAVLGSVRTHQDLSAVALIRRLQAQVRV